MFVKYGWRAASALATASFAFLLFILLLRGPHCPREKWFGYQGGIGMMRKKRNVMDVDVAKVSTRSELDEEK